MKKLSREKKLVLFIVFCTVCATLSLVAVIDGIVKLMGQ